MFIYLWLVKLLPSHWPLTNDVLFKDISINSYAISSLVVLIRTKGQPECKESEPAIHCINVFSKKLADNLEWPIAKVCGVRIYWPHISNIYQYWALFQLPYFTKLVLHFTTTLSYPSIYHMHECPDITDYTVILGFASCFIVKLYTYIVHISIYVFICS